MENLHKNFSPERRVGGGPLPADREHILYIKRSPRGEKRTEEKPEWGFFQVSVSQPPSFAIQGFTFSNVCFLVAYVVNMLGHWLLRIWTTEAQGRKRGEEEEWGEWEGGVAHPPMQLPQDTPPVIPRAGPPARPPPPPPSTFSPPTSPRDTSPPTRSKLSNVLC